MSLKVGFVAIVGKPNVGKSSLLNAIIKEKVAIVSPKPQTTRNNIKGIFNDQESQIIFIDTPGVNSAKTRLDDYMQKSAKSVAIDANVILVVLDGTKKINDTDIAFINSFQKYNTNIIVVVNKTDATTFERVYPELSKLNDLSFVKEIIPTSAFNNTNVELLINKIKGLLPTGERYYDDDIYTDKTLRFMVGEIVREKCLWVLQEEIPHGIAIDIWEFKEESAVTKISADIICEKDTHKLIIVGKNGEKIKQIGTNARQDIEKLVGTKVYLNLFVKVRENWRDKQNYVNDFGYKFTDI